MATRGFGRWVFAGLFLSLVVALPGGADDAVAKLTAVSGDVRIVKAETAEEVIPNQVGVLVRDGELFPNDTVIVGPDSSATVRYVDATRFELDEGATIVLQPTLAPDSTDSLPAGRWIKLQAGKIYAKIVAGTEPTAVETPVGIAAVRGTGFHLSVLPSGAATLATEEGLVEFVNFDFDVSVGVPAACGIDAWITRSKLHILASPWNREALRVLTGGKQRTIPPGKALIVATGGEVMVTTISGDEVQQTLTGDGETSGTVSSAEY